MLKYQLVKLTDVISSVAFFHVETSRIGRKASTKKGFIWNIPGDSLLKLEELRQVKVLAALQIWRTRGARGGLVPRKPVMSCILFTSAVLYCLQQSIKWAVMTSDQVAGWSFWVLHISCVFSICSMMLVKSSYLLHFQCPVFYKHSWGRCMYNVLAIIKAIMLVYMCKRIGLKAVKNIDLIWFFLDQILHN